MRRRNDQRRQGRRAPSGLRQLWEGLLHPALLIALGGFVAVVYISLCARVSIMEWHLLSLEQENAAKREQCLALQREIADGTKASVIRDWVMERNLTRPAEMAQVQIEAAPNEIITELALPDRAAGTELAAGTPDAAGGDALIAAAPSR